MPAVPAYTRSHEKTSSAYKSMATTTSTPSTVVENLHAAPRMSSTSRHHAAIGSGNNVERDTEREKLVYVPRHHPLLLQFVQLEATGFEVPACVMDQFGRIARMRPPPYNHHGFLAHQELDTMFLGALGGVFPVGVRGIHGLILVRVLLVLESVVEVLPPIVNEVLLAPLVLQHQQLLLQSHQKRSTLPINLPFMKTITRDVQIPRDLFIPLQPAHQFPSQPNITPIITTS